MANWEQYGIFIVAILIGGGFAFGGIASYAGLTPGGSSNQQEFNASLPSKNYREAPLKMSLRETSVIAQYYDVVFVNAYYETREQYRNLKKLRKLTQKFGDRVYVSLVNSSSGSEIMISYGIADFPTVIVLGGGGSAQPEEFSVSAVKDAVCDSFRRLGDASDQCL